MVRQQEPVVTGDAVVLDVQIAQLPVRALSAMIDVTVVFIAYIIGVLLWATTLTQFDSALSAAVLIIFTVVTIVGYPIAFETATRGRSLGKMALGLRVVSDDGGPERFRQALFRALAGVIEIWTFAGGPAVICSLLSPKGKRIGDVFAGTRGDQRACATAQPAAADAAATGVVGIVAAAVRARRRAGRAGSPIPLPRSAIGSCGAGPDGLPDRRRRRRTDIAAATAGTCRRNWSWPRCWPNGTAANWPGCGRGRRDRRRSGAAAQQPAVSAARSPGTDAAAAGHRGIRAADLAVAHADQHHDGAR